MERVNSQLSKPNPQATWELVVGSLVWVALTDLYIYLRSTGTIRDVSTW